MDVFSNFVPLIAMAALVAKATDVLRFARGQDWNGVLTQAVAWALAVGAIFLLSATNFGDQVAISGEALRDLNGWSKLFVGLAVGSTGSFLANDVLAAVDQHRTSAKPRLIQGTPPTPPT